LRFAGQLLNSEHALDAMEIKFVIMQKQEKHLNFFSRLKRVLIVTCLLLLHILPNIQGQNHDIETRDAVILKDGSVYKGQIIEETTDYMYMVILEGQTIDIPQRKIKKVLSGDNYIFHSEGRYHYKKGFFWNIELGANLDEEGTSEHSSLLLGYRFDKRWSAGLGFGTELHSSNISGFEVETLFTSYFLYSRYYLLDNRRRPFLFGRVGYGAGPSEGEDVNTGRHSGGFQYQGGVGIHFASRKRARFILSVGYHSQYTSGEQFYLDDFGSEIRVQYDDIWLNHVFLM